MRRVLVISSVLGLVMVAAACRHDGRTLREPSPNQNLSISTTTIGTAPPPDDLGFEDIDPEDTDLAGAETLPGADVLALTVPWKDGAEIDSRYTCDGLNVAPAMSWSVAPEGTVEIAVTLTDVDTPDFTHWVIAGIPPEYFSLAEGDVPLGAVEATNGLGDIGYTGPCPPSGTTHSYVLTVHYLGEQSGLDDGSDATDMMGRIDGITLASAEVTGTYSRP